ncbi:MAG: ABC transporter ATP-binding protein [Candidatus Liptonbacteria bacterium]|nr:ABC transporter ATP-binding protein [Candidatus Liptonbacteria bacterium]
MIKSHKLVKAYGEGELQLTVLKSLNVEIEDGEFLAIVGPSGAGKSTLLYQLSLLDEPTSGTVHFDDIDTSLLSQAERTALRLNRMGFVFQDYALLPELTAEENVALPMLMQGMDKKAALKGAGKALERVGLLDKRVNLPSQLSGGQQQRVSIARAIAHHPHVLFADEPTANLDSTNGELVMEAFKALHKEGQTIVMITHEEEYARHARRVLSIKDGQIVGDVRKK